MEMIIPSKEDFLRLIECGKIPPIYCEIPFSSPQKLYVYFASPKTFLLESIKGPKKIAKYSFIGFDPCLVFKIKNGFINIESKDKQLETVCSQWLSDIAGSNSAILKQEKILYTSKPHSILKKLITRYRQYRNESLPDFQGGFVGVLSYDFVQYLERIPQNAVDDLDIPDAHFFMIDRFIALDHFHRKGWIIVCPGVKESLLQQGDGNELIDWSEKYSEAEHIIWNILRRINSENLKPEIRNPELGRKIEIIYEMKKNDYMDIVKRAKEYISAGDIFQANLSQRVSAYIRNKSHWRLYEILSLINPSPFAAFIDFGDYKIVSSSPERLIRIKNNIIETRPIAGTRPRGRNTKEDELMRIDLLLNEKERAEHIMLIDLERNDLGRVSFYGSVTVDELMITEDYSHVIHIVSNIRGNLAKGKDCFDAIKAAFPGGTITGVPKVRCMEIIDELEPVKRGPYTGSIGYLGFSGDMDLNIIIRTFVIKGEMAYIQVGAGIVADSDPGWEYYETLKKAEALIRTLEMV